MIEGAGLSIMHQPIVFIVFDETTNKNLDVMILTSHIIGLAVTYFASKWKGNCQLPCVL
jgi:hypothetical protein